jgi:hypothetical protein
MHVACTSSLYFQKKWQQKSHRSHVLLHHLHAYKLYARIIPHIHRELPALQACAVLKKCMAPLMTETVTSPPIVTVCTTRTHEAHGHKHTARMCIYA